MNRAIMEAVGYTKKLERIDQGLCPSCSKPVGTFRDELSKKEFGISGLCQVCQDEVFGINPQRTSNNPRGSDVTNVLNNDHAQAAQKYLDDKGFSNKWQVVLADDKTLMLDYDNWVFDGALPGQFYDTLGILEQTLGYIPQQFEVSESKGGNTHALIHLSIPMSITQRIAWQAAFGSDPKREALHLLSVSLNELNPILLFMKKPEPQKLLGTGE
jgi:hypothetical protein